MSVNIQSSHGSYGSRKNPYIFDMSLALSSLTNCYSPGWKCCGHADSGYWFGVPSENDDSGQTKDVQQSMDSSCESLNLRHGQQPDSNQL